MSTWQLFEEFRSRCTVRSNRLSSDGNPHRRCHAELRSTLPVRAKPAASVECSFRDPACLHEARTEKATRGTVAVAARRESPSWSIPQAGIPDDSFASLDTATVRWPQSLGSVERKAMIGQGPSRVGHQAGELLNLYRWSVHYEPVGTSENDLALMAAMDDVHMKLPFHGVRRIRGELCDRSFAVGRQHVATLIRRMGIAAPHPKRRLSKPAPGHKVYPYLLRGLDITAAGQVWSADITYRPRREASATLWRSWTGRAGAWRCT